MEQFDLNDKKILDPKTTSKEITLAIPMVYERIKKEDPDLIKEVKSTYEETKKKFSEDDQKSGDWFWKLIQMVLDSHSKNITVEYLKNKYKAVTKDILAKKIIQANLNASVIIGMISGSSGGVCGLITSIPATFTELVTLTSFQLKMIYELSVLYGKPLDLNDPEEAYKILRIAFGIKVSEAVNLAAINAVKKGGGFAFKIVAKRVFLSPAQEMFAKLGIVITQRAIKNIAAKAIPLIGMATGAVICAVLDYFSTQSVASNTIFIYRTPQIMIEHFNQKNKITKSDKSAVRALTLGCLYMANSDTKVDINELALIEHFINLKFVENEIKDEFSNKIKIYHHEFMESLDEIRDDDHLESIYIALQLTALADKRVTENEKKILRTVGKKLGLSSAKVDKGNNSLKRDLFLI